MFRSKGEHRQSGTGNVRRTLEALRILITLGKLRVQTDYRGRWLVNGRADIELGKARGRIVGAARAGIASGEARRNRRSSAAHPTDNRTSSPPKSSDDNDLDRTAVRNHQPPTIKTVSNNSTDAPRASGPAADGPAARALGNRPRTMNEVVADLARKRRTGRTP
jgi:hypothetical protein